MEEVKGFLKSKTVWGGLIALLSTILSIFGYNVGDADQAVIVDAVASIGGVIGGLLAIYGRVKATKKIG